MKKSLLAAILMVLSVVAFAKNDKEKGKEKKSTAPVYFANELEGANNITWSKNHQFQKVTFTKNGVRMTAFYNWRNELIATTQIVDVTTLPAKAIENLVKYYGGNQMGEIVKYKGSETVYFVNLQNDKENFLVKIDAYDNVSYFKKLK